MEPERRFVPLDGGIEIREEGGEAKGIAGMGAVFNAPAIIAGRFEERIAPGAFDDILNEDTPGLFNHNPDLVLGRSPGTMRLSKTKTGIRYDIPKLPKARADVLEAVQRRDVRGNSFSFIVDDGGEEWIDRRDEGKLPLRIVNRIKKMPDIGPVTFPAYETTTVSARSLEHARSLTPAELAKTECGSCAELRQDLEAAEQTIAGLRRTLDRKEELLTAAMRSM